MSANASLLGGQPLRKNRAPQPRPLPRAGALFVSDSGDTRARLFGDLASGALVLVIERGGVIVHEHRLEAEGLESASNAGFFRRRPAINQLRDLFLPTQSDRAAPDQVAMRDARERPRQLEPPLGIPEVST